jgi:hypothetical protein
MRLKYHPDAESELIKAARYYESCIPTLGVQFLNEADRAASSILKSPERWRIIEEDIRSYLMPRFPYAIYYRAYSDRLHSGFQTSQPSSGLLAISHFRVRR